MKTPLRVDAAEGTTFVVIGDSVEINRHDQPIAFIPLADLLEAARSIETAQHNQHP